MGRENHRGVAAGHVLPFLIWIGVILLLQGGERVWSLSALVYPWSYAVKSVVCGGLFIWLRPWRIYPALKLANLPVALGAGVLVAVVWILPETPWFGRVLPGVQEFYHRWLIMMPGGLPDYFVPELYPELPPGHASLRYAPALAGWGLTLSKVVGSAVVIAVVEEFFFRGFLYRWLRRGDFWELGLMRYDAQAFWVVAAAFALEHDRWLAGLIAAVVYGVLVLRRGDIWAAAVAHGVTNLILALYVIVTGQYGFW